jgi:hypothetical protein
MPVGPSRRITRMDELRPCVDALEIGDAKRSLVFLVDLGYDGLAAEQNNHERKDHQQTLED